MQIQVDDWMNFLLSTLSLLLCQPHKTSVTVQLIDFVFINSKFSFFWVVRSCEVSLVESKVFKTYTNLSVRNLCCVLCFMWNNFVVFLHSLSRALSRRKFAFYL